MVDADEVRDGTSSAEIPESGHVVVDCGWFEDQVVRSVMDEAAVLSRGPSKDKLVGLGDGTDDETERFESL